MSTGAGAGSQNGPGKGEAQARGRRRRPPPGAGGGSGTPQSPLGAGGAARRGAGDSIRGAVRERGAVMAVRARVCPDGPRSVTPGILPAGPPAATLILRRAGAGFALPLGRAGEPGTVRLGCGRNWKKLLLGGVGEGVAVAAVLGPVRSSVSAAGTAAFHGPVSGRASRELRQEALLWKTGEKNSSSPAVQSSGSACVTCSALWCLLFLC